MGTNHHSLLVSLVLFSTGSGKLVEPSTDCSGILVLHSLATAASTHFMELLCSFSVFPHSVVCSQSNQQEINVICDVLYLPATSSMSDGRISCWQVVYATECRSSSLRKTFLDFTALSCGFGYITQAILLLCCFFWCLHAATSTHTLLILVNLLVSSLWKLVLLTTESAEYQSHSKQGNATAASGGHQREKFTGLQEVTVIQPHWFLNLSKGIDT